MTLDDLSADAGYWYLATPYAKYPDGLRAAYTAACELAAFFLLHNVSVYCPISHHHSIALHGGLDPVYNRFWHERDRPLMIGAAGLIVGMLPSWEDSAGIAHEIDEFNAMGKPVHYWEPRP